MTHSHPRISPFFTAAISCAAIAVLASLIFSCFGRVVESQRKEQIRVARIENECYRAVLCARGGRFGAYLRGLEQAKTAASDGARRLDDTLAHEETIALRRDVGRLMENLDLSASGGNNGVRLTTALTSADVLDRAIERSTQAWIIRIRVISVVSVLAWSTMVVMLFVGHHAKIVALVRAGEKARSAEASERRFRSLLQNSADVIAVADPDGSLRMVSEPVQRIWGHSPEDLVGRSLCHYVHPDDRGRMHAAAENVLGGQPDYGTQVRILDGAGAYRPFRVYVADLTADSNVEGLLLTFHDLTERQAYEEELTYHAFHDRLTGLPNRALFLDRLSQRMGARACGSLYAAAFIDLDNFKVINDSLGHAAGDQLLVAIAERLSSIVGPGDTVARLGGDEFTVLLHEISGLEDALAFAEDLKKSLQAPVSVAGRDVFVTASVGIAMCDEARCEPSEMLRDADTAMYHAKGNGKSGHAIFDTTMNEYAVERLELETDLRSAIEQDQLVVYYQPIVSMKTGALRKVEALLRWDHPVRGLVPPLKFVPIAEETGLICEIGHWVMEESCRQLVRWEAADPAARELSVSVNVSGKQFQQANFVERVQGVLLETGLSPRRLELEVTETAMLEDLERMTSVFEGLRKIGVRIAIDDFGTGYSSISYLSRLPVDTLKIDRSFVSGLGRDERADGLVQAIIAMARTLGMSVTSEGIETVNQYGALKELGCDSGQGYLFAKPQPARQIADCWALGTGLQGGRKEAS